MKQFKELYKRTLDNGLLVESRAGNAITTFADSLKFDLSEGFPAVTSKKLAWQTCVGELLWFLSGSTDLRELRHYTFNDSMCEKWTIWDDDFKRWNKGVVFPFDQLGGHLYGHQWRNYEGCVDQITGLIEALKTNPNSRRHIVMAWNPRTVKYDLAALPPCHMGFEVVVLGGKLNMKVFMRSNDLFLGCPMNCASYALLAHLLAAWTGYDVGELILDITNPHIYENHIEQVEKYINNKEHSLPELILPEKAKLGLKETLKLTALDFKDALKGYINEGQIKAPLSVG